VAYAHQKGHLWFRSFEHFQKLKSTNPGMDRKEGDASYKLENGYSHEDVGENRGKFILSFTEDKTLSKFGEWTIALSEPQTLLTRLKECFPKGTGIHLLKMTYDKEETLTKELPSDKWFDRKFESKPPSCLSEREWRFLISLPTECYRLENDTLKWDVGCLMTVLSVVRSPEK